MLFTAVRPNTVLRTVRTIPRRYVQSSGPVSKSAEVAEASIATEEEESSGLMSRFVVTAEVTVSKIFPAGFGWQSSSIVAENYFGYAPETMSFALTTGFGDGLGVLAGHTLFYSIKKAVTNDDSINMTAEAQTGFLLGSAAFCSGTVWQPLVNALQGAELSFNQVFCGTWVGCGLAFYAGLRMGRTIFSGFMSHIPEPTYENSKADASLSVAIGSATAFFVGTDAVYLPSQNFLIDIVGIKDGTPDLLGCAIAGSSTSLGFVAAQSGLNMIYPAKKCWND
mmetsp:Transcript_10734/g.16456  ORF Transcript_10734/g.16456 Transcript_10734/m.16456 type:complete len:280 (-) Transcript_10734:167-1006(-)